MIHSCSKRYWYVRDYLLPSLLEQGIPREDITIFNDDGTLGNLKACMTAFTQLLEDGGTWHLQDDVVICHDFKERTEKNERDTVVCGFSSQRYDGIGKIGTVYGISGLWYSFPCIYIPNKMARECGKWILEEMIGNPVYKHFWEGGINDDWAFRQYINTFHKNIQGYNIKPNLVDHIDYLIGGTVLQKDNREARAQYFEDDYLVKELENSLYHTKSVL